VVFGSIPADNTQREKSFIIFAGEWLRNIIKKAVEPWVTRTMAGRAFQRRCLRILQVFQPARLVVKKQGRSGLVTLMAL